jgi:flagellar motility protein MotE (MotC chaperone)
MKYKSSKIKILPTIFVFMTFCLIFKLADILKKIDDASASKSNISFKTSFVNEVFASGHKPAAEASTSKTGHGEEAKSAEPEAPAGLSPNKNPKSVDKAYRNNAAAASGLAAYTPEEVELLQNLSKRKIEILKSQEELELKTKILEANELQLNKKLEELRNLKGQLEDLMAQYNEKENMKIASLVKIYENMKPKDAAKIFEELDMPILLQVVNVMKESKVAPILSAMDPIKAKEISTEFANQKKLVTQ